MPLTAPLTKALIIHIIMARNKGEQLKKEIGYITIKVSVKCFVFCLQIQIFFWQFELISFQCSRLKPPENKKILDTRK